MDSMNDSLLNDNNNNNNLFLSKSNIEKNVTLTAADITKNLIPEQYQIILLSLAYGIISILALIGNSSIIYIVLSNRRMHTVTNYFICNLSLADCLVACFAVPFQFQAAALQKWVLPHILCKLAPFFQILSVDVSIYTLVAVSLDRYYVMIYPLKPKLSLKSALIIFIIIWLIAFLSSIPSLIFYNVYLIDDFGYQCLPYKYEKDIYFNSTKINYNPSYYKHKIYIVYNIYSQYIIPFIIISCAYFRIGSHLYFSKPVGQTKYQEVITRNKRKVLKMLFVVVALFLICWFPLQLYNFLNLYKPEINDFKHIVVLWLCANWLAMSNSCHNPFIYGFCSVGFLFLFIIYLSMKKTETFHIELEARFNIEFRKLYKCFPCIDKGKIDGELTDTRTNIPLLSKQEIKNKKTEEYSRNSLIKKNSHKKRIKSINIQEYNNKRSSSTSSSSILMKKNFKSKRYQSLNTNNYYYYSSKPNRSINNCEKFIIDQDLKKPSNENHILEYRQNQSKHFT
ncbi:unnamed protein product [Rotaria sp. Silwood1]|nr:unnamed protein product [Rotaria sp. Silwood1]CAF1629284.1 unnamed protein product [Rotaria sp. Silwood1]